ncbi:Biotin carboxyl carrier protein of acetyl-CoA carboxylase (plasmid) [Sulfitobacter sp. THAF37]|uniref:acetyl-CoA carboxylase n=1 Tax=Sulfitobacter sp. THAF37 TaxID=2587855 RepID=UPI001268A255|nr:acetyl-CoA carboxylase [Sulfitobacter sp. THAF37]QFT60820.1 Biotin carboxyl carrier protein of acetyl-CoA carboxylase [Sulfitobacter sp. THAF37]
MADIQAPVPGTFYHKPSPEDPPFKSEGDKVATGETIGLVEVMKSFIEVQAEADGTFGGYAVENEAAVSAGDVLATLK